MTVALSEIRAMRHEGPDVDVLNRLLFRGEAFNPYRTGHPGRAERIREMLERLGIDTSDIEVCAWTNQFRRSEQMRTTVDGDSVSEQAAESYGRFCDHCGELFHMSYSDIRHLERYSNWVCNSCLSEHYTYCDDCEQYIDSNEYDEHQDEEHGSRGDDDDDGIHEIRPVESTGSISLRNSRRRPTRSPPLLPPPPSRPLGTVTNVDDQRLLGGRAIPYYRELILSYSSNVLDYLDGFRSAEGEKLPPEPLWLGVELEVEAREGAPADFVRTTFETVRNFAILKFDGTLGGYGFEIVSVPGTLGWHRNAWEPFFERAAPHLRSWATGRCGMHVHINRHALSNLALGKLMVFINSPENLPLIEKVAGRGSTQYSRLASKKVTDVHLLRRHALGGHYDAISLSERNGGATIELRIFRGNVARHGFYRNLEFTAAACEFATATGAGRTGIADFCGWFSQPSVRSQYPFLTRWMRKHGFVSFRSGMRQEDFLEAA